MLGSSKARWITVPSNMAASRCVVFVPDLKYFVIQVAWAV
jgi:hypothetical protein